MKGGQLTDPNVEKELLVYVHLKFCGQIIRGWALLDDPPDVIEALASQVAAFDSVG